MLATRAQDDLRVSTVTFESDRPGSSAVGGTSGTYPSYSSLIAQPVHDGAAAVLLVLLPQVVGDTVVATSSIPGRALRRTSSFVTDRLALLPVTSPESSAGPPNQPVQVRTDGRTACRLTVGSWWDGPAYVAWNPLDTACAPVDGGLHLLLADDRRYSSGRRPDHLVRAEAIRAGDVIGTVLPPT